MKRSVYSVVENSVNFVVEKSCSGFIFKSLGLEKNLKPIDLYLLSIYLFDKKSDSYVKCRIGKDGVIVGDDYLNYDDLIGSSIAIPKYLYDYFCGKEL